MMIPCEDCLVFILCKARLHDSGVQTFEGQIHLTYGITGVIKKEKCPRLERYIFPAGSDQPLKETRRIQNARQLFGLPE